MLGNSNAELMHHLGEASTVENENRHPQPLNKHQETKEHSSISKRPSQFCYYSQMWGMDIHSHSKGSLP
jgi:hypothetical protein